MMFLLLGTGIAKALAGDLPMPMPADVAETTGAIGVFLTPRSRPGRRRDGRRGHLERHPRVQAGVAPRADDPDVDGMPPGRHVPRARSRDEAQTTPSETKTVISQVGRAVFGAVASGRLRCS